MNRSYRVLTAVLFCLALTAVSTVAFGQDWWGLLDIETTCDAAEVTLTVTFNPWTEPPPAHWAGWIIERTVVGKCVPVVRVCEPQPLPTEPTVYVFVDTVEEIGYDVIYRAYGVDAAGVRQGEIDMPYRKYFEHADCAGGPSFRGTVRVYMENWFYFEPCEGYCWLGLSTTDGSYPDDFLAYDGQTVDLYGELRGGMEGIYIDLDFWFVSPSGCGPVSTEDTSWGALKARYR